MYAVLCNCVYQREESTSRRSLINFGTVGDVGLQKVSYYRLKLLSPACCAQQQLMQALLGFTISILIAGGAMNDSGRVRVG